MRQLTLRFTEEFRPLPPYDFDLTVHKPAGWDWLTPFEAYANGVIWSGFRLTDGEPVGIKARSIGTVDAPRVLVLAYAARRLSARRRDEIREMVRRCLAIDDDLSSFYRLARKYPVLKRAATSLRGMRDTAVPDLFSGIITAITLQLAPMVRTRQMVTLLYTHFGDDIVFDEHDVTIVPLPSQISKASEALLRKVCKLGFRAPTLKGCAAAIARGQVPDIRTLEKLDPGVARKLLKRIKGLGDYSIDILGVHPSFPVDSWSSKIFAAAFKIRTRSDAQLTQRLRSFAESTFGRWQSYVYAYVLNDLPGLS